MGKRFSVAVCMAALALAATAAPAGAHLYLTGFASGHIDRSNHGNGGAYAPDFVDIAGGGELLGIAAGGGHVYALVAGPDPGGRIVRANPDGSGVEPQWGNLSGVQGARKIVATDDAVYLLAEDGGGSGVWRFGANGGTPQQVIHQGSGLPAANAIGGIDVGRGSLYFTAGWTSGRVELDTGTLHTHAFLLPACDVAVHGDRVYWHQGVEITRTNLDLGSGTHIATLDVGNTCHLEADDKYVYFTDTTPTNRIRRRHATPAAGQPVTLVDGLQQVPFGFALDTTTHTPLELRVEDGDDPVVDTSQHRYCVSGTEPCSLRRALAVAGPGDTVALERNTYTLHRGTVAVDTDVTVRGEGAALTQISGGDNPARLFDVGHGNSDAHVTFERLTLQRGRASGASGHGGAIHNKGTVTLDEVEVARNVAADASPAGGNGGAFYNEGTLVVERSTVQGNQAGSGKHGTEAGDGAPGGNGGAIYNAQGGKLTVRDSTLIGNEAGDGSAVVGQAAHGGNGGAIFNAGELTVINSTIVGNHAGNGTREAGGSGGAIAQVGGQAEISFSTISTNANGHGSPNGTGGALSLDGSGTVTFKATILTQNQGGAGTPQCAVHNSTVNDAGHNVAWPSDGGCPDGFAEVDPVLSPAGPADNGGPTQTIALLPASPAVNAVPMSDCKAIGDLALTADQRGMPRPFPAGSPPGNCDIGAFEHQLLVPVPTCQPTSATTEEGASVTVALACFGGGFNYEIVEGPSNGSLGAIDQDTGHVVYTPSPGFAGEDSFTYRATNPGGASAVAKATIDVDPQPPACADVATGTSQGKAIPIQLTCTGGGKLTYSVADPPNHGSITGFDPATGVLAYKPNLEFAGEDSFTFRASNSSGDSEVASARIAVAGHGAFKVIRVKVNKRNGTATVGVDLPSAGQVTLSGHGIATRRKTTDFPTRLWLKLRPKASAKVLLRLHGKAKVTAQVRFAPRGGEPRVVRKKVKLVRR